MIVYQCDRCRKQQETPFLATVVIQENNTTRTAGQQKAWALCNRCLTDAERWLNQPPPQPMRHPDSGRES